MFYNPRMVESRATQAKPPKWASDPVPPPLQAVAEAMADGETWLFAWAIQSTVSYRLLSRECRIKEPRLLEIDAGSPITRDELAALAKVWKVTPADIMLTLPPCTVLPDSAPTPPSPPDDPTPAAERSAA